MLLMLFKLFFTSIVPQTFFTFILTVIQLRYLHKRRVIKWEYQDTVYDFSIRLLLRDVMESFRQLLNPRPVRLNRLINCVHRKKDEFFKGNVQRKLRWV
jgi:hypothetical protein